MWAGTHRALCLGSVILLTDFRDKDVLTYVTIFQEEHVASN